MNDVSILIGGKAGFGIDAASLIIGAILNKLGYRIYIYREYPSLIRGGHTFSIIRGCREKVYTHRNKIDFLLALNQDTFNFHKDKLRDNGVVVYDSDVVNIGDLQPGMQVLAIPASKVAKEENAAEIMRNTCLIGAFCKAAGIGWPILEQVFKKRIPRETEQNLKVASVAYNEAHELVKIPGLDQPALPIITGNEAIGLGLVAAGLNAYIAYPMTPSSAILHFLAGITDKIPLKVIHPESEIAVMLMALGAAYAGDKVAVGTSGGGFCLMTEGLSLSAMAELPVTIVLGQRTGPSTGLPTYTGQTELQFALSAGHGEFSRFVVAPGDAEEAYFWSAAALNMSSKYQIPSIILSDKTLAEGTYSFDIASAGEVSAEKFLLWDRQGQYKRYLDAENGVSGLAFPSDKDAVVKINSYEHDEYGITTEDPAITVKMQEKRLCKGECLSQELENYKTVNVYGNAKSKTAVLCWGSNKGVCIEAAESLGLKVIQPVVLWPFSVGQFKLALKGVKQLICVENSATGQLPALLNSFGIKTDKMILKYDGRPFELAELEAKIKEAIK
ncbi:MAG: 2-oxoacid:acceptor oxidoreductase subunit alpha [Candidatus Omnitrophota bacterium]